jgi:hypothetical protein
LENDVALRSAFIPGSIWVCPREASHIGTQATVSATKLLVFVQTNRDEAQHGLINGTWGIDINKRMIQFFLDSHAMVRISIESASLSPPVALVKLTESNLTIFVAIQHVECTVTFSTRSAAEAFNPRRDW